MEAEANRKMGISTTRRLTSDLVENGEMTILALTIHEQRSSHESSNSR